MIEESDGGRLVQSEDQCPRRENASRNQPDERPHRTPEEQAKAEEEFARDMAEINSRSEHDLP